VGDEDDLRAAVARQRVMSQDAWAMLQAHGVTEDTDLSLELLYFAGDESKAEVPARHLKRERDYEVRVEPAAGSVGLFKRKKWVVTGTTRETKISLEILNDWITWMVVAGFKAGCEFDRWGTRAPR
jgi:hypothetical protein